MDRTELAARARLAEQAERYDDMANYMKKVTLAAKEGKILNDRTDFLGQKVTNILEFHQSVNGMVLAWF